MARSQPYMINDVGIYRGKWYNYRV